MVSSGAYPDYQQYVNPLKWGWYYVSHPDMTTGLMSKRAARKLIRRAGGADPLLVYGARIGRHPRAPRNVLRYVTFPFPIIKDNTKAG